MSTSAPLRTRPVKKEKHTHLSSSMLHSDFAHTPPPTSKPARTQSRSATSVGNGGPKWRFAISEERILQITNDIAENMLGRPPVKELVECIKYWSLQHSLEVGKRKNLGLACASATLTALETILKAENDC